MIILTGGSGFIGSVMLRRLNEAGYGYHEVMVVDIFESWAKLYNMRGKRFKFCEKNSFFDVLGLGLKPSDIDAIIHLGAMTSTTETNWDLLKRANLEYSRVLAEWAIENGKRFIYASSAATYGDGSHGFSDSNDNTKLLKPLNLYGESKQKCDLWLIENGFDKLVCGFKFFNVFGPNEYHKGAMASLAFKAYHQIAKEGALLLFKSADLRYKDGEFKRDFIYVMDAVDVVMWALENPSVNGIFNLGTGKARSWNDLAVSLFDAMDKPKQIIYIDMPENVRKQYQYFTQADMTKLRNAGYDKPFRELEDSVADYVQNYLTQPNPYY